MSVRVALRSRLGELGDDLRARGALRVLRDALFLGDRSAYTLIALFALPYVWLIFSVRYLPMQDLPGHIELAHLHHQIKAGDAAFTRFYQISPQPWPNSLTTIALSFLGGVAGFETSVKLALAIYAVTWPLSLALLAKQLGRTPAVALLTLPTVLDFHWAIGFVNYLLAKPLIVVTLIAAIAFARRSTLTRGLAVFALVFVTFLGHAIAYAVVMAGAGFAIVFFSRGWRRLSNLWPLLPACLIPLRYLRAQAGEKGPGAWVWYNFDTGIPWAWNHLGDLSPSNGEEWAYVISFALWLLVFFLAQHREGPFTDDEHSRRSSVFLWLAGLGLFITYGWGPAHMPNVAIICVRVLVFAWVLMLLLPLALPRGWPRGVVLAGLALAVGIHVQSTHAQYAKFNEIEMPGFEELVRMIPPGKALAVQYQRPDSRFAKHRGMWHWPKLYGVWQGGAGRSDDTFAWRSTSYVTLTREAHRLGTFNGSPGLNPAALARWDYLIVHGGAQPAIAAAVAPVAEPVASRAEWHLFHVRGK
jgi:hypothetical protein